MQKCKYCPGRGANSLPSAQLSLHDRRHLRRSSLSSLSQRPVQLTVQLLCGVVAYAWSVLKDTRKTPEWSDRGFGCMRNSYFPRTWLDRPQKHMLQSHCWRGRHCILHGEWRAPRALNGLDIRPALTAALPAHASTNCKATGWRRRLHMTSGDSLVLSSLKWPSKMAVDWDSLGLSSELSQICLPIHGRNKPILAGHL
jgi:hypothetical protein